MSFCLASTALADGRRVFPPPSDPPKSLRDSAAHVLSLSEEAMLAIVPAQSGIFFTRCPGCDAGMADSGDWEWSPAAPERLKCKGCGAEFPGNARFPDDKAIEVKAPDGVHRYPYYADANGYRFFLRAKAAYFASYYMAAKAKDMAQLYTLTHDETCARRATLILLRFAEVYPTWAHKYDVPFRQKKFSPFEQNRIPGVDEPYRTSRWGAWAYYGVSVDLLEVYDRVRDWPGLDALANGKARQRVEQGLFASMVEFVMGFEETYSNMSPGMWRSFILSGRVLGRPEWLAEGLRRLNTFLDSRFLHDGYWMETSPSYCRQVWFNALNVIESLKGYDPASEAQGESAGPLAAVIAKTRQAADTLGRAYNAIRLPSGADAPINDTWHPVTSPSKRKPQPLDRSQSRLAPGFGVAALGAGEGSRQMMAWLDFTSGSGHKHSSALSIGLFALDDDLLPDIGYTHTAWRSWSTSTHSHNTVVVNGVRSAHDKDHALNRLRLFASDGRGFHIAEAESDAAYSGVATRYRRTLALIGESADDAYVIDVFQVHGGDQHDYLLHGPASQDSTASVSGAALEPFSGTLMNPGVEFEIPRAENVRPDPGAEYGFVRGLRRGKAGEHVLWDMRLKRNPAAGLRSTLLAHEGAEIYLGEAPSIRQAGPSDLRLKDFYAPFFCARRAGRGLKSVFVAVHEPVEGQPVTRAVSVQRLDGGLLVTVEKRNSGRDFFIMALDASISVNVQTRDGPLAFAGAYGLALVRNGRLTQAHLINSASISIAAASIQGKPEASGRVLRSVSETSEGCRGWFDVGERVESAGAALLIEFADKSIRACNVVRVEPLGAGSRLFVAETPGFIMEEAQVKLTSHPQRDVAGAEVRYRLAGVVHRYAE